MTILVVIVLLVVLATLSAKKMLAWCYSRTSTFNVDRVFSLWYARMLRFLKCLREYLWPLLEAAILFPFKLLSFLTHAMFWYFLSNYIFAFKIVDTILSRLLKIPILTGCRGLHVLYATHLVYYLHLLAYSGLWRDNDMFVALYTFSNAVVVLDFARSLYSAHCLQIVQSVTSALDVYGWRRNVIYFVSVVCAAFLVTFLVSSAYTTSWKTVSDEVLGRLEDSVLVVEEDRIYYIHTMVHPYTKGEVDPKWFNKLYRYRMEDVEMTCNVRMVYLADGRPGPDFVTWRHNGVPIENTHRHYREVTFKEIPDTQSEFHRHLRQSGASEYDINATLTITLLHSREFGSYTCHAAKFLGMTLADFKKNLEKLYKFNSDNNITSTKGQNKSKKMADDVAIDLTRLLEEERHRTSNGSEVDIKRLFQDHFTCKEEFRLIKLERKKEVVRAPAGSMLSFTHSYWHVFSDDVMVDVDYTVNGVSFDQLCPDMMHGCSKLLMLYWFWGHETGVRFGLPPLTLFTIWKANSGVSSDRFHLIHCMCENAYGHHEVRYIRRYFNQTSGREESVDITHPHTLLVTPRKNNMLNVFSNRSECAPFVDKSPCEQVPPVCRSGWDIEFIKEFASVVVTLFGWMELTFLAVAIVVGLFLVRNASWFLGSLGRLIERLTLEGSMSYYWSAVGASPGKEPPQLLVKTRTVDVYLSYAEAGDDRTKVHEEVMPILEDRLGLKIRAKHRGNDVPVNQPEIRGISKLIERSKRVVIFLSEDYLKDIFFEDIEAPVIVECFCDRHNDRGPEDVLIVKLGACDTPLWASRFDVHDWTSSTLSVNDHMLKLVRWLEPRHQRSAFRSPLDWEVTFFPLMVIAGVFVFSCVIFGF